MDFSKIVDDSDKQQVQMFETELRERITEFLHKHTKVYYYTSGSNVVINDNFEICVNGEVTFRNFEESSLPDYINFRTVTGQIEFNNCINLTSLRGLPKWSGGIIIKDCPKLKSLEYLPIAPSYLIDHTGIRNLTGFPESHRFKAKRSRTDSRTFADLLGFGDLIEYPELTLRLNNNLESLEGLPTNLKNLTILRCKKIRSIDGIKSNILTFKSDLYAIRDKDSYIQLKGNIKNFEYTES